MMLAGTGKPHSTDSITYSPFSLPQCRSISDRSYHGVIKAVWDGEFADSCPLLSFSYSYPPLDCAPSVQSSFPLLLPLFPAASLHWCLCSESLTVACDLTSSPTITFPDAPFFLQTLREVEEVPKKFLFHMRKNKSRNKLFFWNILPK